MPAEQVPVPAEPDEGEQSRQHDALCPPDQQARVPPALHGDRGRDDGERESPGGRVCARWSLLDEAIGAPGRFRWSRVKVLAEVGLGHSNTEIATRLHMSEVKARSLTCSTSSPSPTAYRWPSPPTAPAWSTDETGSADYIVMTCSGSATGNLTPVRSSETAHSRRCTAISYDSGLEVTSRGWPMISMRPPGP